MFQSLCLALIAVVWMWAGLSTWSDLIGKPRDAPFLWIPGHFRSIVFWWLPAMFALAMSRCGRHVPLAFAFLSLGPGVRFGSYMVSWMASWSWIDPLIPDDDMKGDPHAWGSAWIYLFALIALAAIGYAAARLVDLETKTVQLIANQASAGVSQRG